MKKKKKSKMSKVKLEAQNVKIHHMKKQQFRLPFTHKKIHFLKYNDMRVLISNGCLKLKDGPMVLTRKWGKKRQLTHPFGCCFHNW